MAAACLSPASSASIWARHFWASFNGPAFCCAWCHGAFKSTDVIDIRDWPTQEQRDINEQAGSSLAKLFENAHQRNPGEGLTG